MNDLLNLIQSRKSVRTYSDKHISDEDLRKILEAGRLAPNIIEEEGVEDE